MATGNNTATFAQVPRTATAVVTAAVASVGTPGTIGSTVMQLLIGAPASAKLDANGNPISYGGSIITRLTAMPLGATAANSLLLYLSNDAGVTLRLIDSETLPTQTASTGAGINETTFANYSESRPLRIGAGDRLYVGSQIALAAGIVFKAELTDF
jgi:hypothetical protein